MPVTNKDIDLSKILPDIEHARKKQYLFLREAVWKHMEAQRSISIFSITATLTLYSFIFISNIKSPYSFLMAFFIILPFSYKEMSHNRSIAYIAAYQIVCLENNHNILNSFSWETDYFLLNKKKMVSVNNPILKYLVDCEFVGLAIMSYLLFAYYYYKFLHNFDIKHLLSMNNIWFVFISFIVAFLTFNIFSISNSYNHYVGSIEYYIKKWLRFMREEGRIDQKTYVAKKYELISRFQQGN